MNRNNLYNSLSFIFLLSAIAVAILFFVEISDMQKIAQEVSKAVGIKVGVSQVKIYGIILIIINLFFFGLVNQLIRLKSKVITIQKEMNTWQDRAEKKEQKQEIEENKDIESQEKRSEKLSKIMMDLDNLNLQKYSEKVLVNISKVIDIVQGMLFCQKVKDENFEMTGTYAYYSEREVNKFKTGEGISGQVAKNQDILNISNVPKDYITILSGLGKSYPRYMLIVPIIFEEKTIAILELASFKEFTKNEEELMKEVSSNIAQGLNNYLKR